MRVPAFFAPLPTTMPDGVDVLRNWVREATGDPERPYRFRRRPGRAVFASGLHGPVRGGIGLDGASYVVAGERFYSLASDGTATELGTCDADSRPVCLITNGTAGNQVGFTAGGKLWVYNTSTLTFAEVTDADLPGDILGIVHTDTYGIAWFKESRAVRISDLLDLTTWAGGDVAERSQYVDDLVSVVADQTEVTLLGSQTQETWWNSGNNAFPFEPVPNALSRQGSAATHGACLVGDAVYWLAQSPEGSGIVMRLRGGYTPERISTHWVERKIQGLTMIADAIAYSAELEGHRWYVLTFPSEGLTLAFDEAVEPAAGWSEWSYRNPDTAQDEADLARCHWYAFGHHLVGSRVDGTIYRQSFDLHDDAGAVIRCQRRFRGPRADGKRVQFGEVRLDAEVGVGVEDDTSQGYDPMVTLRKSRDGGRTWGPEIARPLGKLGEYGRLVRWQRGGSAHDPAWDLVVSDPAVSVLHDFHVEASA